MFEYRLFFGFQLDDVCRSDLNKLPKAIKVLFILNGNSDYLQEIEVRGNSYLGKFLNECTEIPSLDLIGKNVLSLLKRLLPDCPYDENSLVLLTVPN